MSNYIVTPSGVKVYKDWQDNIIIDADNDKIKKQSQNPINSRKSPAKGLSKLGSSNSEDALTWNIFRTLQDVPASLWLHTIIQPAPADADTAKLQFWKNYEKVPTFSKAEGSPEVDLTIETDSTLICIEAKYKSNIGKRKNKRDQMISTIDVGSWRAHQSGKAFYFCYLTPLALQSKLIPQYQDSEILRDALSHRTDIADYESLASHIFHIHWETIIELLKDSTFQGQAGHSFNTLLNWLDGKL